MKIMIKGREPQEIDLSIDRLEFGAPTTDVLKPVVLYLSGPFWKHRGFLDLVVPFGLELESATVEGANVLQVDATDNMKTIHVQISGRIKIEEE